MLTIKAIETNSSYEFTVTDGTEENIFVYSWGKMQPEGQTIKEYLQNCKQEALLLAQHEIDKKAQPIELTI